MFASLKKFLFENSINTNYKQTISLGNGILAKGIHSIESDRKGFFSWTGRSVLFRALESGIDGMSLKVFSNVPCLMRLKAGDNEKVFFVWYRQRTAWIPFSVTDTPVLDVMVMKPLGPLSMLKLWWGILGVKVREIAYRRDGTMHRTAFREKMRPRSTGRRADPLMQEACREVFPLQAGRPPRHRKLPKDERERARKKLGLRHRRILYSRAPVDKRLEIPLLAFRRHADKHPGTLLILTGSLTDYDVCMFISALSLERNVMITGNDDTGSYAAASDACLDEIIMGAGKAESLAEMIGLALDRLEGRE